MTKHVGHIDLELYDLQYHKETHAATCKCPFEKALFIPSSLFEMGVHSCINDARGM